MHCVEQKRDTQLTPLWTIEILMEGGALQPTVTLARCGREAILVDTGYQRQEAQLLQELGRRGLTAESISCVMNTHLHFDHCHNNSLFPKARILCSEKEYEWITGLCDQMLLDTVVLEDIYRYYPELRSLADDPRPIWTMVRLVRRFWRTERIGRKDQIHWLEASLLPDGVRAVHTPGHVPHHFSFVFKALEGEVLVAGDAMITRGDADEDVMTFPPTCRSLYAEIKKTLGGFPGTIIPGHDAPFVGKPQSPAHPSWRNTC